jgi:SAM-dependent methyltransferase
VGGVTCEDRSGLPGLRANNQYLLEWMRRNNRPQFRALDYGCGDGALVFTARAEHIDAYGAETYYDGARPEDLELVRRFDPQTQYVREIVDAKLPFDDGFFDLIAANQVFEHIQDLAFTARELHRVMRSGGQLVSIFPTRQVLREGHLCVPLIHRLPKGNFRRRYYQIARKVLPRAARVPWGEGDAGVDKAFWFLDSHVCYRSLREVRSIFQAVFEQVRFIEPHWLAYRMPTLAKWLKPAPGARTAAAIFSRYVAGTVLLATKA